MSKTLILGAARSGTSMTAGLFADAGVYMGKELLPPTISNPRGYFECSHINRLNNQIIGSILFAHRLVSNRYINPIRKLFMPGAHIDRRAFAVAAPTFVRKINLREDQETLVRSLVSNESFCFKDPRFAATLPSWQPYLPADVRYVIVFREPDRTVDSILRNAREIYKPPLDINESWCYQYWGKLYKRLLQLSSEKCLFLHYNQIMNGAGVSELSKFCDVELRNDSVEASLRRSVKSDKPLSANCSKVYRELCERAGYSPA